MARRLVVRSIALATAMGGSACLFPSLDDLNGKGTTADSRADAGHHTDDDDDDDSTTDDPGTTAAPPTKDAASPVDAAADATVDAGPRTYFCPESTNGDCVMGQSTCCGLTETTAGCVANDKVASVCQFGFMDCSDNIDCPTSQTCCGIINDNPSGLISSCKTACAANEDVLCNPAKPHCPSNQACTGFTDEEIPFCQ